MLIFAVVMFYDINTNTGLENTEPLFPGKMKIQVLNVGTSDPNILSTDQYVNLFCVSV